MSNCETIRDDLKAYVDGQLSLLRKSEVALHLARCAGCRREAEAMRRIGDQLRALDLEALDSELRARILERTAREAEEETEVLPGRRG
ncbi:MAG TPA: zf-HC2 domain-containing protein [Chthonomonadaceae bacterium]|nr:zf-HC2 domain-containing protein [Chthonomonadaceae bacterium]